VKGRRRTRRGGARFLKRLKEPGLRGVRLIVSDAYLRLSESAAEFSPTLRGSAASCMVRQHFSHVPSTKVREIATMLKAIHASEDIVATREKAVE
jgi:putative transposase